MVFPILSSAFCLLILVYMYSMITVLVFRGKKPATLNSLLESVIMDNLGLILNQAHLSSECVMRHPLA
jgi:hypothetical protein